MTVGPIATPASASSAIATNAPAPTRMTQWGAPPKSSTSRIIANGATLSTKITSGTAHGSLSAPSTPRTVLTASTPAMAPNRRTVLSLARVGCRTACHSTTTKRPTNRT
jgi:hypothetical protein